MWKVFQSEFQSSQTREGILLFTGERENKKRKYDESDDDTSRTSDDDLQSSEAAENESGTGMEDESDPWIPIIEEVQRRHATAYENAKQSFSDNGFDNEAAKEKAYEIVLPKLLTELERAYTWNVYYG